MLDFMLRRKLCSTLAGADPEIFHGGWVATSIYIAILNLWGEKGGGGWEATIDLCYNKNASERVGS